MADIIHEDKSAASFGNKPIDSQINQTDALKYWASISPTVSGLMGGYPQISRIDLQGSANFLAKLRKQATGSPANNIPRGPLGLGVDCGAGIGRVTHGFLARVCRQVDIVEPVDKFVDEIEKGESMRELRENGRIGQFFRCGLEGWEPTPAGYDLIWNQWCLGHLTDEQLTMYLTRCRSALTADGWVVVKENMSTDEENQDVFDDIDSSVTRTDHSFRRLFKQAGFNIIRTELQTGFPKGLGLYPVRMYALRPTKVT
ncbi:MAG: hypothetical protein M1825_005246 [Sarcosagium campestre]|nr:MAG: hypothetical protein M1825_005246 [Sarcosagium campestre]